MGKKMNTKMPWVVISSLVGQDAKDAIYKGILEEKSNDEIIQDIVKILKVRMRKEEKLARGLLDMAQEEYGEIREED